MNFNRLKINECLSETNFFVVEKIVGKEVQLKTSSGKSIVVNEGYVNNFLQSADQFDKEEKRTKTELAEILINSPRIAITVAFFKQSTEKTKKVFETEKQNKIDEISNAKVADIPRLLSDLIENPITKTIPGELRIMKGRHYSQIDDLGRVKFTDMEVVSGSQERQVDTRSLQYIIVNNTKYILIK